MINPAMTYFRAVRTIIGPTCLTAVFGMGTGVATWVSSPENSREIDNCKLVGWPGQFAIGNCQFPVFQLAAVKSCVSALPFGIALEQRINAVKRLAVSTG